MQKPVQFLTGSQFVGNYNKALHCMEGYGIYTYPDGSEYRGYFKEGKFHGYGQMVLRKPFSFTFTGVFENGKLVQLGDMFYRDGLHLKAKFENNKLDFDDWKYCSETDRRFAWEILHGIGPTGQQVIMSNLDAGSYDVGGGIYKERTGFIVRIPPPFFSIRFLSCDEERRWILKNCRKGPYNRDKERQERHPTVEPIPEIGKEIIDANMKEYQILHSCSCNKSPFRRSDYPEESLNPEKNTQPEFMTSKSTSKSSFCGDTIEIINIAKKCQEEVDTLKLSFFQRKSSINPESFRIFSTYGEIYDAVNS